MEKEKTAWSSLLPSEAEGSEIRCSLMLLQGQKTSQALVPCLATPHTLSQCGCY